MNDELNSFGYASSAPDLIQDIKPPLKDEEELSTLLQVLALIESQKALYSSTSALSLDAEVLSVFSVEQQLAINLKVVMNMDTLSMKIKAAINKVKEHQDGREF